MGEWRRGVAGWVVEIGGPPVMGQKTVEPELYINFSLDAVVPSGHLVRQLASCVDFSFIRPLVRPLYSHTGQPSVDPVVLFKLVLLGYLHNIRSERQLCEEAALNLAWRWFLGYELTEPIPDHSVLTKARQRFGPAVYAQFFQRVVELCGERGLIQGRRLYVDSTLVAADASAKSVQSRTLLRQLPGQPAAYLARLEWAPEAGRSRPERKRSVTPVGAFVVSRTDPDAALISHSPRQKARLMHKVHMAVDGGRFRIVTAVTAVPASHGDGQGLPAILDQHQDTVGSLPQEAVADTGYATVTAFQACADRGVVASIPSWSTANRHGGWDREHFAYDAEHDRYVCPQGQQLRRTHDNLSSRQQVYRAPFGVCPTCPVRQACGPGLRARTVTRSFDHELLEAARNHMETAAGRAALRKRKQFIELVFADAKVRHCLTRAQRRGRDNMWIQALLTATAMNLRKLIQCQPPAGGEAAAMRGQQPLQGLLRRVWRFVDWAARARSPFAASIGNRFSLPLPTD